jgi:hypothetical protein
VFEGIWENGKPIRSVNHDDGGDDGMDDSVFGW